MASGMPTAALALSTATLTARYDPAGRRFLPATLTVTVTNIGMLVDQFNIDVLDIPAGWFTRSVPGMRMRPGIDGTSEITFHPPVHWESTAGPHPFKVRVTPQEQPDSYVEYGASLVIEPFVNTQLLLEAASLESDTAATFRPRLINEGNVALAYTLSALSGEEPSQRLALAFMNSGRLEGSTLVSVGPGQTVTPELSVAAPPLQGIARQPGPYPFQVKATAAPPVAWPDLQPPPLLINGTLVLRPPAPVQARIEPASLELVDLLRRDGTAMVVVSNPSRRRVGVALKAEAPTPDLELELAEERLVLEPESEQSVALTVRRAPLAAPATTITRQNIAVRLASIELAAPAEPDPFSTAVVIAHPKDVAIIAPPPIEVTIHPPGLKVEITPRRRKGGKGRYSVNLVNQGNQRVRTTLDLLTPDSDLDYVFGKPPSGLKMMFKRLFWRGAVPEAQSQIYGRMSSRANQVLTAAGTPDAMQAEPDTLDESSYSRAFPVMLEPQGKVSVPLTVSPGRFRLFGRSQVFPFQVTTSVNERQLEGLTREAEFEHRPFPILLALLIVFLLLSPLFIIIPLKLGCDRGTLEFSPYCVPGLAPNAPPATVRQEGGSDGKTKVILRQGIELRTVAEEPAAVLPGQFAKLAVPSPDQQRVVYVTAKDELLAGATIKLTDVNGNASQLKTLEKGLWPAKPVWCQRQSGDPGRIAYVTASDQVQAPRTGLQLRVLILGGADVVDKLLVEGVSGAQGNGFGPEIFYGRQETPLLWWDSCNAVKYTGIDGKRYVIDLRADTPSPTQIRTFGLPDAQPAAAQSAGGTGAPCEEKPFAQTDPRWAQRVIGKPGGPVLGAHGCALAAAATVFKYYKTDIDPNRLLQCAGEAADFFRWGEVAQKCSGGKVSATTWKENPTFTDIGDALRAKQPAIVGLAGGPTGSHYVIAAEGSGESGGDFRIWDPWDGTSFKTLGDYLATGSYRLKWLVRYEGAVPVCAVGTGATAPGITFAGVQDGATAQQPVQVRIDAPAGAVTSHPSGTTFDKDGFHSVGVALADGTYRSLSFFVDRAAPKTTAKWEQEKDKLSGLLTLTAKDTVTPIAVTRLKLVDETVTRLKPDSEGAVRYGLATGQEQDYTGDGKERGNTLTRGIPLEFTTPGNYRVQLYSIDAAGNRENVQEFTIAVKGETPTPQIVPGQLNVGARDESRKVNLQADKGQGILAWKAVSDAPWLSVTPAEGELKAGDKPIELVIKVDRNLAPVGEFTGHITVSSKSSGTELSATLEVTGRKDAPAPVPTPTPTTANPNQPGGQAGGTPAAGRGACSQNQLPFVEPATITIDAVRQIGTMTFRDLNNQCIQWYATEVPPWLALEAEDINKATGQTLTRDVVPVRPGQLPALFTTDAGKTSTLTFRPDWNALRSGQMTEGRIVLREDSAAAHTVVLTVRVGTDRRSVTVQVTERR